MTTRNPLAPVHKKMMKSLSSEEILTVCFYLNGDYESLRSQSSKSERAIDVITYCKRMDLISELVEELEELRPDVDWKGAI